MPDPVQIAGQEIAIILAAAILFALLLQTQSWLAQTGLSESGPGEAVRNELLCLRLGAVRLLKRRSPDWERRRRNLACDAALMTCLASGLYLNGSGLTASLLVCLLVAIQIGDVRTRLILDALLVPLPLLLALDTANTDGFTSCGFTGILSALHGHSVWPLTGTSGEQALSALVSCGFWAFIWLTLSALVYRFSPYLLALASSAGDRKLLALMSPWYGLSLCVALPGADPLAALIAYGAVFLAAALLAELAGWLKPYPGLPAPAAIFLTAPCIILIMIREMPPPGAILP